MDEMKIQSKLLKWVFAKLAKNAILKNSGYDTDIQINELYASVVDGDVHIRLNADLNMERHEFERFLKSIIP